MSTTRQNHRILNDALLDQLRTELCPLLKEIVIGLKTEMPPAHRVSEDRLVSRRDAARMLGVSVQTIVKMFERGDLNYTRIGRRVLVRESDVKVLVHARQSSVKELS